MKGHTASDQFIGIARNVEILGSKLLYRGTKKTSPAEALRFSTDFVEKVVDKRVDKFG